MKKINALLYVFCLFLGCSQSDHNEIIWRSPPLTVDITKYGPKPQVIEFSTDNKYLCAAWPLGESNILTPRLIFNMQGNIITNGISPVGDIDPEYVPLFRKVLPISSSGCNWLSIVHDKTLSPQWEFIQKAESWVCNNDLSLGLRINKRGYPESKKLQIAELMRLDTNNKVWEVELPIKIVDLAEGGFFEIEGKNYILLAYEGSRAIVLSQESGEIIYEFFYNRKITDDESLYNIETMPYRDRGLGFWNSTAAFDSTKKLLACGESTGKRVRVYSLTKNGTLIFEANANEDFDKPSGGIWQVDRLEFAASGNYLIADYSFGGRSTDQQYHVTDIFDTSTWSLKWKIQSSNISSLTISPNGEKAALIYHINNKIELEIGNLDELCSSFPKTQSNAKTSTDEELNRQKNQMESPNARAR
jgi:hypothetical protein